MKVSVKASSQNCKQSYHITQLHHSWVYRLEGLYTTMPTPCCSIHNSYKMEIPHMYRQEWLDQDSVVHMPNEITFAEKKNKFQKFSSR